MNYHLIHNNGNSIYNLSTFNSITLDYIYIIKKQIT